MTTLHRDGATCVTKATRLTRGPKVASKICEVLASQEVEKEEAENRRSKAEGVKQRASEEKREKRSRRT